MASRTPGSTLARAQATQVSAGRRITLGDSWPASWPPNPSPPSPVEPWGAAGPGGRITASEPVNVLLAALLVLNLLDAVFTLFWVTFELTTEENPLMAWALEYHPLLFMAVKLGLVGLAVLLIQRYRHRTDVKRASWVLVGIYYWIGLYHAWFYGSVVIPVFF